MPDLFGITLIKVKYEFNIAMLHISPPQHPQAVTGLLVFLSLYTAVDYSSTMQYTSARIAQQFGIVSVNIARGTTDPGH